MAKHVQLRLVYNERQVVHSSSSSSAAVCRAELDASQQLGGYHTHVGDASRAFVVLLPIIVRVNWLQVLLGAVADRELTTLEERAAVSCRSISCHPLQPVFSCQP
jgi:hypothetical protein